MPFPCSPAPSPYVDTLDDVLLVLEATLASRPRSSGPFGTIALLLDGDDRLLTAVECHGCDTGPRIVELCSVLLAAASSAGSWRRCVLASDAAALDRGSDAASVWAALNASFDAAGVELVDWLVVPRDLPLDPFGVRSASAEVDGVWPW